MLILVLSNWRKIMSVTDEIFQDVSSPSSQSREVNAGAFENKWNAKIAEYATNVEQFNIPFTKADLGEGQLMSVEECGRQTALHNARNRAGEAANAKLDADLQWADVRIKETRLIGKQLTRGIYQAKNVQLTNELVYQVGVIELHGEKRALQLKQLSNTVQGLRNSVKASSQHVALGSGIEQEVNNGIDFMNIDIESPDIVEK
jgi:hypothetical protein